jgi:hypothetical protein
MVKRTNNTKENFDSNIKVNDKVLEECLRSHYRSLCRLIKYLYFDTHHPEKMNIKVNSKEPSIIYIIKDQKWTTIDKDFLLDTILLNLWKQLYDHFCNIKDIEAFKDSLTCGEDTYQRIETFMDEFKTFCESGTGICWNDQKNYIFNYLIFLTKKKKP